jgi:hypothetical protein
MSNLAFGTPSPSGPKKKEWHPKLFGEQSVIYSLALCPARSRILTGSFRHSPSFLVPSQSVQSHCAAVGPITVRMPGPLLSRSALSARRTASLFLNCLTAVFQHEQTTKQTNKQTKTENRKPKKTNKQN